MYVLDDRKFGVHSNIPACCIEFYIQTWANLPKEDKHKWWITRDKLVPGYIRCNNCLTRGYFRHIHTCGLECREVLLDVGFPLDAVEKRMAFIKNRKIKDGSK